MNLSRIYPQFFSKMAASFDNRSSDSDKQPGGGGGNLDSDARPIFWF